MAVADTVRAILRDKPPGWEKAVCDKVTELENELAATKIESDSNKEDFERERKDRENFHGTADEEIQLLRTQIEHNFQDMSQLQEDNKRLKEANKCESCKKRKLEAQSHREALGKAQRESRDKDLEIRNLKEKLDRIKLIQSEGRAHSPPYAYRPAPNPYVTIRGHSPPPEFNQSPFQAHPQPTHYYQQSTLPQPQSHTSRICKKPVHQPNNFPPHHIIQQSDPICIQDLPEPSECYNELKTAAVSEKIESETTHYDIQESPNSEHEHYYQNLPGEPLGPCSNVPLEGAGQEHVTLLGDSRTFKTYGAAAEVVSKPPGYQDETVQSFPFIVNEPPHKEQSFSYAATEVTVRASSEATNGGSGTNVSIELSEEYFVSGKPNKMQENLTKEIKNMASDLLKKTRGDSLEPSLESDAPFDPNLVCPMCHKQFRYGEIQKFRRHVGACTGPTETSQPKPRPVPTPRRMNHLQ